MEQANATIEVFGYRSVLQPDLDSWKSSFITSSFPSEALDLFSFCKGSKDKKVATRQYLRKHAQLIVVAQSLSWSGSVFQALCGFVLSIIML